VVSERGRTWWLAFLAVAGVHLVGQLTATTWLHQATKPLLMPILLAWFVSVAPPGRVRLLVIVALGWSWLGDLLLMGSGESWFLAGLGAFLLAQLTYVVTFWRWRADSVLRRPLLLAPYVLALVGLLAVLWADLGDLRGPIVVYAVVIVAMAALATGAGRMVAVGAALFVLSDALIAVGSLTELVQLPRHGFWVMATYLAAQALIARGIVARVRSTAVTAATGSGPRPPGPAARRERR
jgi:uncharacterized membrane protein YhhN